MMTTFKTKFWQNAQVLSLGVFDEVSVSKFSRGLGLEGYALDCIAGLKKHKNCSKPYCQ